LIDEVLEGWKILYLNYMVTEDKTRLIRKYFAKNRKKPNTSVDYFKKRLHTTHGKLSHPDLGQDASPID
jgi:hypothetical protein